MRATTPTTRNFAVRGGSIAGMISLTLVSTHGQFSRPDGRA